MAGDKVGDMPNLSYEDITLTSPLSRVVHNFQAPRIGSHKRPIWNFCLTLDCLAITSPDESQCITIGRDDSARTISFPSVFSRGGNFQFMHGDSEYVFLLDDNSAALLSRWKLIDSDFDFQRAGRGLAFTSILLSVLCQLSASSSIMPMGSWFIALFLPELIFPSIPTVLISAVSAAVASCSLVTSTNGNVPYLFLLVVAIQFVVVSIGRFIALHNFMSYRGYISYGPDFPFDERD